MSKIRGISHVVLHVNDLDRMVAFYRDMLDLVKYREHAGRMVFLTPDSRHRRSSNRFGKRTHG
jgi:catechol 2,3-dioxygenase-like lactoylglutathione lyase family enzyme